jgi:hypothetical protein
VPQLVICCLERKGGWRLYIGAAMEVFRPFLLHSFVSFYVGWTQSPNRRKDDLVNIFIEENVCLLMRLVLDHIPYSFLRIENYFCSLYSFRLALGDTRHNNIAKESIRVRVKTCWMTWTSISLRARRILFCTGVRTTHGEGRIFSHHTSPRWRWRPFLPHQSAICQRL